MFCVWVGALKALREGRRCITIHWLNTILKKKRMVPPHRALHLPFAFPPGAKPGSQHVRPTVPVISLLIRRNIVDMSWSVFFFPLLVHQFLI